MNVKAIPIGPTRKKDLDAVCTGVEQSMLRGRYGSLSWLQRQTRPDLSFASSSGQTALASPTVRDIVECNKAIDKAHEGREFEVVYRGGFVDWATAEVLLPRIQATRTCGTSR